MVGRISEKTVGKLKHTDLRMTSGPNGKRLAMKVFQIGFNKCGTHSLHQRFLALGLNSVHWASGKIARRMNQNIENGYNVIAGLQDYDAFTDLMYISRDEHIEAFKYYDIILLDVPDALFIYNTRNKENWLKSCCDHPNFLKRIQAVYGYKTADEVIDHWSRDWDEHYANVVRTIPPEKLLVFNIETDDAREIDRFVGFPGDLPRTLAHANFTYSRSFGFLLRNIPSSVKRLMPEKVRHKVRYALRARR